MAIFKCPKCHKTKTISKFRTYFRGGKQQNIDLSNNQEIVNIFNTLNIPFYLIRGDLKSRKETLDKIMSLHGFIKWEEI